MFSLTQFPLSAATRTVSVPDVDEAVDSVTSWWNDPTTRDIFVTRPLWILLILIIALVLHLVVRRIITKAANNAINSPGGALPLRRRAGAAKPDTAHSRSQEQRRQQRILTLANVGRSAAAIVIWVWAVLAVLDQIGVNVAPLVASAGVVGVALGFGAQSLVKDFLSGIFMLLENQYGVGDVIAVNDIEGTVEHVTMRITTVRDIDGTLWYVRNGDIDLLGNQSDVYSVARLEIPVSIQADPEQAASVVEAAMQDAVTRPEIADKLVGEATMLGISKFDPECATLRVMVNTLPGEQWGVSRFMTAVILEALHTHGVPLPGTEPTYIRHLDHTPGGESTDADQQ